jgi:hypothetical protein
MSLDGAHHANEPRAYDDSAFDDYFGTPWLTGIIFFASAVGTFVGAWTLIILFGQRHRGFSSWWPRILILVVDLAINVALRVERTRRRRARGIEPPQHGRQPPQRGRR